ncbi:hypothetical protein CAPTEDRAFT_226797 [Capitella teleta]|uniref:RING-type domain-containing protein n=1 Tax=Capitella teleta TaxID=283909 RepID=N1PB54_CAPTE|nr:hypothetical protein CAPTEDRAFT_226797 [Capitella teleta]|eukprot:ELU18917.1 hypothetical protein CAPTEDRAFT_226797 [Capitella teleta]
MPNTQMTTSCPALGQQLEDVRPKSLSQSCVLTLDDGKPEHVEDVREEKIKKWKQAGGALRRVLSRITKTRGSKKTPAKSGLDLESNHPPKKTCKRLQAVEKKVTSPAADDPMNAMLADFQSAEAAVEPPAPETPKRPMSTFAELKEKIRRMTSASGGSRQSSRNISGNSSKKRHKVLRHSKSQDSGDKGPGESSESESDDFRMQKPHKSTQRHFAKEKRKSIDNAAFSLLKCGIGPGLSQVGEDVQQSLDLSDSLISDGEIVPDTQSTVKALPKATASNVPLSKGAVSLLKEAESFANLADVESCNSDGEVNSDDQHETTQKSVRNSAGIRGSRKDSGSSAHTLCSTSEDEQLAAGLIHCENYSHHRNSGTLRKRSPPKTTGWAMGDEGSDDESDLFDDLPDLRLHLPNSSSSDADRSPVLRISHADMDRLPNILSTSSSSEEEEGADADDEFECDCPLCRFHRGGSRDSGWPAAETLEDASRAMFNESEADEAQAREFAHMLLSDQGQHDSLLEMMFQNVILQMISVYPDLLNDQAPPPISPTRFTELPTIQISQPLLEKDNTCPICLCSFEISEEAKILPCQHHFHTLCIQAWLKKSGTCPVCRHVLAAKS